MANDPWQERLDAHKLCAAERTINLTLQADQLTRVADLLIEATTLSFSLAFSYNAQRQAQVCGRLWGEVVLQCERCLQPVKVSLDQVFHWGLVATDEAAAQLPKVMEPVLLDQGRLALAGVLEDEVLLALPLVALHESVDCGALVDRSLNTDPAQVPVRENKHRPFEGLAQLKKTATTKYE